MQTDFQIRSQALENAFQVFNEVSAQLAVSYQQLQQRVELLSQELASSRSERMRQLAEKEKLAERLSKLLDALPAGVVLLDGAGRVREINPVARDLLGVVRPGESWTALAARVFQPGGSGSERPLADGFVLTLHVARPGESFAEASLFADRYHCDAIAETASRVAVYSKAAVLAAFDRDPAFARRLTALLADQVRALRALLEIRNVRQADERVLQYLRFRALAGDLAVERPARSIAAEVGLTQETLYRTLRRLEEHGLIHRDGRRIRLAGEL